MKQPDFKRVKKITEAIDNILYEEKATPAEGVSVVGYLLQIVGSHFDHPSKAIEAKSAFEYLSDSLCKAFKKKGVMLVDETKYN
jgi:hypothetical protein